MNYKHLGALILFCTCTMSNHLFAQSDIVSKAMLLISYKKSENAQKREQINLAGEAAYRFDVADFLSKNKYQDIQINGHATVNYEKQIWQFRSRDLQKNETCEKFIQTIVETEKRPFLGVSVIAMEDFSGVQVVDIIEGSGAEAAGFQVNDIITVVNDFEIYSACDLTTAVGQTNVGDLVDIDFLRADENQTLRPTLGYRSLKRLSWKPSCNETSIALENETATDVQEAKLSVFPNPTKGMTQVSYTATNQAAVQISLTDLTGKIILNQQITDFDGFYLETMDLTTYPEGIYFLNITQGDVVQTEKIVLQKH